MNPRADDFMMTMFDGEISITGRWSSTVAQIKLVHLDEV
jgi:hypothetical protein